jgi:hypothetical protein
MHAFLPALYDRYILKHPVITLAVVLLLIGGVGSFATNFQLDASEDTLVLENDADLKYYRSIRARYGTDNYLIVTYTPHQDLFSAATLEDLRLLRNRLRRIERVASVVSILDVPLLESPGVALDELQDRVRTLEDADVDPARARAEFLGSPLYSNNILSPDAKTTALRVVFGQDEGYRKLLDRRNALREQQLEGELAAELNRELAALSAELRQLRTALLAQERADIAAVRAILDLHRPRADLHLGGVPMIAADMIDFIRHDLATFGVGVLIFMFGMLALIFRKLRWVLLPLLCCAAAVLFMFGFLGLVDWRVTVVSSNFTSLLLIITLSLTVHLVVRYHELYDEQPQADQHTLVLETVRSKVLPSFYTALTTIVAFASLLVSGIRPVIDFGWMMAIGICVSFLLSFALFPAGLMLFKPARFVPRLDITGILTGGCVRWIERHGRLTLALFGLLALLSLVGISRLTVENRFIDHFKQSTEIYRGMELIDRQLGGTTPLDVIIDADPEFLAYLEQLREADQAWQEDEAWDAEFGADGPAEAGLAAQSYWYNTARLDLLQAIHGYLDQLPESGKVLSLSTTMTLLQQLNEDKPLDNIMLSVVHKKLPEEVEKTVFRPYMSSDGNQVRFALRVFESDPQLRRQQLLQKIRRELVTRFDIEPEQVHLSGMLVLYNNLLRSLYRSQILSLGVVFTAIMLMFLILFRSLRLAVIAIIPNLIAAGSVLGLMGWLNIPLDIMTITIAAITIGIAVDDTIHYVHRFRIELREDGDPAAAIRRCHASVGRAMYYTSITIIAGFSLLALSEFVPTIYFGLFTGLAMAMAMIANLTLLALLLRWQGPALLGD